MLQCATTEAEMLKVTDLENENGRAEKYRIEAKLPIFVFEGYHRQTCMEKRGSKKVTKSFIKRCIVPEITADQLRKT